MPQAGSVKGGARIIAGMVGAQPVAPLSPGEGPDPAGEAELLAAFGPKIAAIQEQVAAEHAAQAAAPASGMGVTAPQLPTPAPVSSPTPTPAASAQRTPTPAAQPITADRPLRAVPVVQLLTELGVRCAEAETPRVGDGELLLTNAQRNTLMAMLDLPALTRGQELLQAVARLVSIDTGGGLVFPLTPAEREEIERRAKLSGMTVDVWFGAVVENLKPHILSGAAG